MQRKTHLCLRTGEEAESQPTQSKEDFFEGDPMLQDFASQVDPDPGEVGAPRIKMGQK